MANGLLSPKIYANTGLKLLKNKLVAAKLVSGEFKDEFKKTGTKTWAKRPPEFVVRDGPVAQVQDVVEGEVEIALDKQKGVDIEFTSIEETLTVDALLKSKAMNSAMGRLANQIDADIHAETKKFFNWVGTPGSAIDTYAKLTKAMLRMDEGSVEADGRVGFLQPSDAWALVGNLSGNYVNDVAKNALTRAKLPLLGDVDWYATQNAASVTTGTRSGDCVTDGANQNVAYTAVKDGNWEQNLVVDAMGNATTAKAGEVLTIAGVYAINPITKAPLPYLQQFTLTQDALANSTAGGQATLKISPPIIIDGAFQTVSAAPADGVAIQWMGNDTEATTASKTYTFGTAFQKDAIALVSAKLIMPFTGEADYATDPDTGLTVRYWRSSDSTNDTHMHRYDVIYGCKNVDPRRGVRVSGS